MEGAGSLDLYLGLQPPLPPAQLPRVLKVQENIGGGRVTGVGTPGLPPLCIVAHTGVGVFKWTASFLESPVLQ